MVPVPKSVKKWSFFEATDHVLSSLSGSPDKGSNVFVRAELEREQRPTRVFFWLQQAKGSRTVVMSNNDLNFDELEYDPTAFDDINPNELDADELEAELAREEAALLGEKANDTDNKSDVPEPVETNTSATPATESQDQTHEKTSRKEPSHTPTQASTAKETPNNGNSSNTSVNNPGYQRNNRRNNHRPMTAPHMMGNVMNYSGMGGSGMMTPPMMGMG